MITWSSRRLPSQVPATLSDRAQSLHGEIVGDVKHYDRQAKFNYCFSLGLAWLALAATICIAVVGIGSILSAFWLGIIALVPTGAMLVDRFYQPHDRARWHYTKRNRLNALRRRLIYEAPEQLSAENVAGVSRDWETLTDVMDDEWYRTIRIDWSFISKAKSAFDGQSAPPN